MYAAHSSAVILASASPRRIELLRQICPRFKVVVSGVPEMQSDQFTAAELARINALRKARRVSEAHPESIVLGADTLVCSEDRIYGKPADYQEARTMLGELQGRVHLVVTGVAMVQREPPRCRVFAECTTVTFRQLSAQDVDRYLESINPLDKAGAYAIQENGDWIVASVCGSRSNVIGLPVERLADELGGWQATDC